MELKIDPEFQRLIPALQRDEFQQLKENIIRDGCRDALVTWNNTIIDGHNRYKICTEENIPFKVQNKDFDSRDAAIEWIILNQFGRRNLLPFQRSELALRLKPIVQARAKENRDSMLKQNSTVFQKSAKRDAIHTDNEIAKAANVSRDTIRKAEYILKNGTPEEIERARAGGKGNTVNHIYNEIAFANEKTRVCKECGKEKDISEFYGSKRVCNTCRHSTENRGSVLGNLGTVPADVRTLFREKAAEVEASIKDETTPEYTADHLAQELMSLAESFASGVAACFADHPEISIKDNKAKIIAALSEAEAAIKGIMEDY